MKAIVFAAILALACAGPIERPKEEKKPEEKPEEVKGKLRSLLGSRRAHGDIVDCRTPMAIARPEERR